MAKPRKAPANIRELVLLMQTCALSALPARNEGDMAFTLPGARVEADEPVLRLAIEELGPTVDELEALVPKEHLAHAGALLGFLAGASFLIGSRAAPSASVRSYARAALAAAAGKKSGQVGTARASAWQEPALVMARDVRRRNPKLTCNAIANIILKELPEVHDQQTVRKFLGRMEKEGKLPKRKR